MNYSQPISRRTMLRGTSVLLALPFLESLRPLAAFGAATVAKPPLRMGIFTVTGGTVLESWKTKAAGALGELPSILRPLEFAKKDMLLLTGLSHSGRSENVNAHAHCAFLHLTGAELAKDVGGRPTAGISVDQVAAQVAGAQTYLPSLELGLNVHPVMYSFRGPETPVPYESNPRIVFERMFRGRKPAVPNWQRRAARGTASGTMGVLKPIRKDSYEQSVIDAVLDDAKDLKRALGHGDQRKLDEYLESVRSVERRLQILESILQEEALDAAAQGPSKLFIPDSVTRADTWTKDYGGLLHQDPEKHEEYIQVMSDLMVLAFQTDTTRVVTLALGSDEAQFPGVVTVGYERHCHTLEHQGNGDNPQHIDPIAREACRQIHAWYTRLFAVTVQKMKAIDEGGSTLLDNSMILYTSYMADGGHGREDYPAMLLGGGGGTLKTGRQIDFKKNTPVSNLYVEMLNRMGVKADSFGESKTSKNAAYDGRLPDLI